MVRVIRACVELKGSHVRVGPRRVLALPSGFSEGPFSSVPVGAALCVFSRRRKPGRVKGHLPLRAEKQKLEMLRFWHHRCQLALG